MPMPRPHTEESTTDFIKRCMGDAVMVSEFPDEAQRYAVCGRQAGIAEERGFCPTGAGGGVDNSCSGAGSGGGGADAGNPMQIPAGAKLTDKDARTLVSHVADVLTKAKLHPYISPHYSDSQLGGLNSRSSNTQNWTVQDGDNPPKGLSQEADKGEVVVGVSVSGKANGVPYAVDEDGGTYRPSQYAVDALGKKVLTALKKGGAPANATIQHVGHDSGAGTKNIDYALVIPKGKKKSTDDIAPAAGRHVVASDTNNSTKGNTVSLSLLEAVRARTQKNTLHNYGIMTADRYVQTLADAVGTDACYRFASTRSASFHDVMRKASETLVYSNPDMVVQEVEYSKAAGSAAKMLEGVELPKNTLMVFKHTLTTPRKDRDGDILRSQGAVVDPNMLLLWQHVHTLPIGKLLVLLEQNQKRIDVLSCIVDMNDLCHDAAVMVDNKMGRFSHGFRALSFSEIKADDGHTTGPGGFDVKQFEIMEESLVSVPSNVDAQTHEIMLSLIEGGKMTSPMMKQYGQQLRSQRNVSVPVTVDLQLKFSGVDDVNKSGNRVCPATGKEPGAGCPCRGDGAPKETDDGGDKSAAAAQGPQDAKGVKAGRVLSAANKKLVQDAHDLVEESHKMEGVPRPCKSMLKEACGHLKGVLSSSVDLDDDTVESDDGMGDEVEKAMAVVLAKATTMQVDRMMAALSAVKTVRASQHEAAMLKQFVGN